MTSRSYSDRTLKILWGRAGGRCALPDCRREVFVDATDYDPIVIVGDIAHIEGAAPDSARHNPELSRSERDEYENLIVLCKICHAKLDTQKRTNAKEKIRAIKAAHEDWVRKNLPERGLSRIGWRVVVLQGAHPIEVPSVFSALAPDHEDGEPTVLTVEGETSWEDSGRLLTLAAQQILAPAADALTTRVAVFPLAPVSACIGLGYLLTNRPTTRAYQYHRDERSWAWHPDAPDAVLAHALDQPQRRKERGRDVAICFDLSARVPDASLDVPGRDIGTVVRLGVPSPSTAWLQTQRQLTVLGRLARETYERVANEFAEAPRWHIFYAGPAPGAVVVGQQLNPTMTPPAQLYEFQRGRDTEHVPSLLLSGGRLTVSQAARAA